MANVLLIDPPWYALQNIYYDNVSYGLASLAAVLRNNKHNCIIYNGEFKKIAPKSFRQGILTDYNFYLSNLNTDSQILQKNWEEILKIVDEFKPTIIGITIPTAKYAIAIKIANQLKNEFPSIFIIAGGPHPSILPRETIKERSIDIVVKGEGEVTFLELVNAIENNDKFENITGIAYKYNSVVYENEDREYIQDLDSLPPPAWDLTYRASSHQPDSFGTIFSSRGCPYRCIFCASHKIWSRKTRYMSPERVVKELKYTAGKFKTKYFRFVDDTFILDKNRVIEICAKIKDSQMNINWMCDIRANLVTFELLKIMKDAGCVRVNIGVESGNPEILKYIKKDITIEQARKAFNIVKRLKMESLAYFMLGFPNETIKQMKDTVKLMRRLRSDSSCFCIATPYPGTELYDFALQNGILPVTQDWSSFFHHSPEMLLTKSVEHRAFNALINKIQNKIDKDRIWNYRKMVIKRRLKLAVCHPLEFIKKAARKVTKI
ncbi:MAG: radical SAM protein [Candidatus Omnitrophica bacterium]|nr:radical SAM protein [Candidatus Omnitrophota bacterium]